MKIQISVIILLVISLVSLGQATEKTTVFSSNKNEAENKDPWMIWYKYKWYEGGWVRGLLQLKKVRDNLIETTLYDNNKDLLDVPLACPRDAVVARSADGTCNDLSSPRMGSVNTRFGRNFPDAYVSPHFYKNDPNPRDVSVLLLARKNGQYHHAFEMSFFKASFFQFIVHDWFNHKTSEKEYIKIKLSPTDPLYTEQKYMFLPRTIDGKSPNASVPAFINQTTHWWDGSQLYGSDLITQRSLRTLTDGRLKTSDLGTIPVDSTGKELVADNRNWWIGLSVWHEIFIKEHNAIAEMLQKAYPAMTDQELFDKARLINVAIMVKLFTLDSLATSNHAKALVKGGLSNWYGLINSLFIGDHLLTSEFSPSWEKVLGTVTKNDPVLIGIPAGKTEHYGVPYSMTEEWSQVYRYHSLIPDTLDINLKSSESTNRFVQSIPLEQTRFENAYKVKHKFGLSNIIRSMGFQFGGAVRLYNTPKFLQELDVPVIGKIDTAAADIIRERERGIPRYNDFRKLLGLSPLKDFSQLSNDPSTVDRLRTLYPDGIESLDTTVGMLAEDHRIPGSELGETGLIALELQVSRRIQSDRFLTKDFNDRVYTPEGMTWVKEATIKSILLRHFPDLSDDLSTIENPFAVWSLDSNKKK